MTICTMFRFRPSTTFQVEAIVIPVGSGGLIAGIALAVKTLYPSVTIIGVESEKCPSFAKSLVVGHVVYTKPESTLADGLSVPMVGVNAFATARKYIDQMIEVSESDIARAILCLMEVEKVVVEAAGAIGVAALLSGKLDFLKGKKVVFPLCGGNIDMTVLGQWLERGLAAEGRLCRFVITVSDRPDVIAELTAIFAQVGVRIKNIFHERAWLSTDIFRVKCVVETLNKSHANQLERALCLHYSNVAFNKETEMELS